MIGLFSACYQLFQKWLVEVSKLENGDIDV
jgi:hypothetical protein